MRRQYHLWPTEDGFDAWDVDRLIQLTAELAVEEVVVSTIAEIDSLYWFQEGGGPRPTVRQVAEHARLIDEVDMSFPVIMGPDGRIMDGMHRVARALLDGTPTVRAVRLLTLPAPDYHDCRPEDLPYGVAERR